MQRIATYFFALAGGRLLSALLLGMVFFVVPTPTLAAASPPPIDTLDNTAKTQAQKLFVRGMTRAYLDDHERAITMYERALQLAPNEASILAAMADAKAAQDDIDSAIFYAEQARSVAPDNIHYYKQLATLHQQADNADDAIATYRELVGRFPKNIDARLELAQMLSEAYRTKEAIAVYEEIEEQMGGTSPRIYMQMLQLYRRLNDEEGVSRVLRALVELRPDEALFVHLLGQYYMKEGQMDAAIELYEETLATHPDDMEIGLELAEMYREEGRTKEADSLLNRLTSTEGASADQLVQRARSLHSSNNRQASAEAMQQATQLLERALELNSNHEQALHMLGELRYQAGRYAEAGTLFERALDQNPRSPERWAQAAAAYLRADQPEQAVDVAEEGLLLFPGQVPLVRVAAHGLLTLNRNRAAIERFEELRSLLAESSDSAAERADVWATLGLLYSRVDDDDASDHAYEQAIEANPDHAMALNNYAYSLAERRQRLDRAQEMAHRAVELDPENAAYLDTLGWIYFQQEDYAAAEKWIKEAIDTGDASATVYEHYGDVQEALGNPSDARTYWEQALERAPDRDALREKLDALQR